MNHVPLKALVGTVALTLAACNNGHLGRSQVKSQLETTLKNTPNKNSTIRVRVGTVSGNCVDVPEFDLVKSDINNAMLSGAGYITIRPIKTHVWDVELTQRGVQAARKKYGHIKAPDCDSWQVEFVTEQFDHLEVMGIVEDGIHAKVDVSLTFVATPVWLAVAKQIPLNRGKFGETARFLGDNLLSGKVETKTVKHDTFTFDKYDDGWKLSR